MPRAVWAGTVEFQLWSDGQTALATERVLSASRLYGQRRFLDGGPHALVRQTVNGIVSNQGGTTVLGRLTYRARDGIISPA